MAVLVPLRFSMKTGQFRSCLTGKPVDASGKPVPWYTFPASQFLRSMDFSNDDVLEFGGGQSTLWWAGRARSVTTMEDDPAWARYVQESTSAWSQVVVIAEPDLERQARAPLGSKFDVAIIDGGDRIRCAETALKVLRPDGLIILDNSDGFWGPDGTYPILDLLAEREYLRIDFFGYYSVGMTPGCTSLFFPSSTRRLLNLPPPPRDRY